MEIRNFSIIAHIDHGKSTLADRFLEITKTIPKDKLIPQYLDRLDLERERGITIKMQPCQLRYSLDNQKEFLLNLIDTPGHIDFHYEVSRALKAVEGAILLVDVTKGVQSQTLANLELAKKMGLKIIPAINKVDLEASLLEEVKKEVSEITQRKEEEISLISAKTGFGVENLLKRVVEEIPSPKIDLNSPLKSLVFDSLYNSHLGIIAYLRVFSGQIKKGDKLFLMRENFPFEVKKVGYFSPELKEKEKLSSGEIGWLATGIKKPEILRIGETITTLEAAKEKKVFPLPGYQRPQPMVFASIFPKNSADFEELKSSLEKLSLNDSSFDFKPQLCPLLGRGFLLGALGLLHLEIITQRLKRHFGIETIITWPSVLYRVELKDGEVLEIKNAEEMPDTFKIKRILEPWVKIKIFFPFVYFGNISEVLGEHCFLFKKKEIKGEKVFLEGEIPLAEIIHNFYDQIKSKSKGFASYSYQFLEWRQGEIAKLVIRIAGQDQYGLSFLIRREKMEKFARSLVSKLKEILPREQFSVPIQAVFNNKVIARETLPALKKNVTGNLYGGDRTRKMKLWQKQKKGKKRLKEFGQVKIKPEIFVKLFSSLE